MATDREGNQSQPLIVAGILLGVGLAGFFDGIVFHQILQWHQMLASVLPATSVYNIKQNMFWDGLFHAVMYGISCTGIWFLWRAGQRREVPGASNLFGGALLLGAGLFNLIEGAIDHQILGIHHLKPGANQLAWDLGFLACSAILAAAGWIVLRGGFQEAPTAGYSRSK